MLISAQPWIAGLHIWTPVVLGLRPHVLWPVVKSPPWQALQWSPGVCVALLSAGRAKSRGRFLFLYFCLFLLCWCYIHEVKEKVHILPKGTKYIAHLSPPHSTPQFYSLERIIFDCLGFGFFRVVISPFPTMYTFCFIHVQWEEEMSSPVLLTRSLSSSIFQFFHYYLFFCDHLYNFNLLKSLFLDPLR